MAQFVDDTTEDALPSEPAITDIMSVWQQQDRAVSHWGGEMRPGVWPVVAAELAVAGGAAAVNVENIDLATDLIAHLPPPPYPFDVDLERARRGEALFAQACASCHAAGEGTVFAASDVGTDPSRARAFTPYTLQRFNPALRAACVSPTLCSDPGGDVVVAQPGYVATPLDGIWARAPYLHNGSVPTLEHLPRITVVNGVGQTWQTPNELATTEGAAVAGSQASALTILD